MELQLSDEQQMLRESAAAFAARHGGAGRFRAGDCAIRRDVWSEAAEAFFFGALAPESCGGLGLGLAELCLVAGECGRHLVPEPIATGIIIADAIARCGVPEAPAGPLIAGDQVILPALIETPRGLGHDRPRTEAVRDGGRIRVSGAKIGVAGAGDADAYLVSASSPEGLVLVCVPGDEVRLDAGTAADSTAVGQIRLSRAPAEELAAGSDAHGLLDALLAAAHLATAAELLGVMERAHEITLDYLKVRRQFDRPIGSFQALQHRAVDNLAAVEAGRSLVHQAARAIDAGAAAPGLPSAVLAHAADGALGVCKSAVQMHGAIGFTDEHEIGYHLKRAMTLAARWGIAAAHRRHYLEASESGGEAAAPARRAV